MVIDFGFHLEKYRHSDVFYNHEIKFHSVFNGFFSNDIFRIYLANHPLCNIKYTHELQNLIFSITGQELTLKK